MTWHLLGNIALTILVLWFVVALIVVALEAGNARAERRTARKQAECAHGGCVGCGLGVDAVAFEAAIRDAIRVTR